MASFTGHLAWQFLRGRYLHRIEAALGRALTDDERRAFAEDSHGGWFETSVMLLLKPELVDESFRSLPPARFSLSDRLRPNYAVRNGKSGYVGHPALADPAFARAVAGVLLDEAMALIHGMLDGRIRPRQRRSPFSAIPFLRTDFWPAVGSAALLFLAAAAWWLTR
jgi:hypothetical protein